MSQFDKDDVEDLGLLKLDVLGIRMQSSMAHAVAEIQRVDGVRDRPRRRGSRCRSTTRRPSTLISQRQDPRLLPDRVARAARAGRQVRHRLVRRHHHRHLAVPAGAGQERHDHAVPRRQAGLGRCPATSTRTCARSSGRPSGVVVFHEQVIEIIAQFTGCTLAEADEARRALGDVEGMAETRVWFFPRALAPGLPARRCVEQVWKVLEAFASFGFCKAHAAAFALPTYQSAWLKTHYPAHFLAGVLTHDPGMYPKRLILDDARQFGIAVLGLDVNAAEKSYVVEKVGLYDEPPPEVMGQPPRPAPGPGLPDGRAYGIRLALAEVKGISEAEVDRIVAARPYHSLTDFWHRAQVSRPVLERLVLAGGFDAVYGIGSPGRCAAGARSPGATCCSRWPTSTATPARSTAPPRPGAEVSQDVRTPKPAAARAAEAAARTSSEAGVRAGVWEQAPPSPRPPRSHHRSPRSSSPSTSGTPRRADRGGQRAAGDDRHRAGPGRAGDPRPRREPARHATSTSRSSTRSGVTRSAELLQRRSRAELLVAGVKVATQTPPIRSGRRVVFLTLDDCDRPGGRDVLRGRPGALRRHGVPLLAAGGARRAAAHRSARGLAAGHRVLGAARRCTSCGRPRGSSGAGGAGRGPGGLHSRGMRRPSTARPRAELAPDRSWPRLLRRCRRRDGTSPGAGALQRVPAVAVRRHQAGRRGHQVRAAQAVALLAGELGRTETFASRVGAMFGAPGAEQHATSHAQRARTAVVWDALASRAGRRSARRLGRRHRRRHRRVRGPGRRARSPGHRGRPQPRRAGHPRPPGRGERGRRPGHRGPGRPGRPARPGPGTAAPTWCSATACWRSSRPAAALAAIAAVLRPGGVLSLLVNQRHAAVVARAMAGHFGQAQAMLDRQDDRCRRGDRVHRRRGGRAARRGRLRPSRRCTPCGSSSTWCPARWSTSSPVPPPPWSSWSRRSRSDPSTSPSPPSSTPWPPAADHRWSSRTRALGEQP